MSFTLWGVGMSLCLPEAPCPHLEDGMTSTYLVFMRMETAVLSHAQPVHPECSVQVTVHAVISLPRAYSGGVSHTEGGSS